MWRVFDREARDDYGYELLDPEDAAELGTERMKPLDQLADAVDAYWPQRISAFRPHPDGEKHLLTFRGYYTAIFRPASRIAHGEVDALQPYVSVRTREIVVSMTEREKFGRAPFAFPMMAFALLVYHHHFGWPDEARVRHISESMVYESGD